uniref:Uncharacterized protein n=1 Tax=Glossina morsitans morsitans TaxID=37546 RepID=A0ABK9NGB6_GLOMM
MMENFWKHLLELQNILRKEVIRMMKKMLPLGQSYRYEWQNPPWNETNRKRPRFNFLIKAVATIN